MDERDIIISSKLEELSRSKFRSSFHLRKYMIDYIHDKGFSVIFRHANDLVVKNLSDAYPKNDGRQTPMKGHPVFIAQHACACCCRGCLEKWHHIPQGKCLTKNEINYIVSLLLEWIRREYKNNSSFFF